MLMKTHELFVWASGRLATTGSQPVLQRDLQPEWRSIDDCIYPIDAPTWSPAGCVIKYDDRPLCSFLMHDRRLV